jgi:regulator of protease activity HflC (stomatin/prohibitin superfamily)
MFEGLFKYVVGGVVLGSILMVGGCWGLPHYHVYTQRLAGEAKLQEAMSSRKVQIEDARGKEEAAKLLAIAEIERAKGVAEANRIIGESLKNNESYLRYLWIQGLEDRSNDTVVYVPTEAGMPILESNRLKQLNKAEAH